MTFLLGIKSWTNLSNRGNAMTQADLNKIRERIARLRRMLDTVGPNYGDINILIDQEVPALLRAVQARS